MASANGSSAAAPPGMLAQRFPVNSLQELTLNGGETVTGRIYCTDELTGSIVIQIALVHTTLASEIRIIPVHSITKSVVLPEDSEVNAVAPTPLTQPLPKIQKKALEEREKRALRLAEERLRHINQKVRGASCVVDSVLGSILDFEERLMLGHSPCFSHHRHHRRGRRSLIAWSRLVGRWCGRVTPHPFWY